MVFSSHLFLFYFLPLALGGYYASLLIGVLLERLTGRRCTWVNHGMLTLLSYLFYGWANPLFVVLMATSTVIDYACGLFISKQWNFGQPITPLEQGGPRKAGQRIALTISICSNLALLGFFKYFNFGVDSYNAMITAVGADHMAWDTLLRITLPLGISFYTFQSMSYSIDVYRGDARAIRNPIDFSCYVAMFPQLVAGPIIRFQEVDDQLRKRSHTFEKFSRGVALLAMGLTKKVMLANTCGKVADVCFDAGSIGTLDAWVGAVAYAFHIYFDFSAYTDMAIGLGLMMGFMFPKNFDSPYISQSITEFWRRWHISLSTWLRDYLYIPLGGNRKGKSRTYFNLAIVMLLGGLWHGAAWNFVIWGAIHGGMLAFERMQGKDSPYRMLPKPVKIAVTFAIVCFSWVFFRAKTLDAAIEYCGAMLGMGTPHESAALVGGIIYQPWYLMWLTIAAVLAFFGTQSWDFTKKLTPGKALLIAALFVISVVLLTTQSFNPFIYFIF